MIAVSIERDFWIFFSPLQAAVVIERLGGRESKKELRCDRVGFLLLGSNGAFLLTLPCMLDAFCPSSSAPVLYTLCLTPAGKCVFILANQSIYQIKGL